MSQEIKVTFIDDNEWKLPFNFALGLHILVIIGAVYMPQMFQSEPMYKDIYTVDLINTVSVQQELAPAQQKVVKEQPVVPENFPKPEVSKEAISINDSEPVVEKQPAADPVSIKPLKRKKIRKNVPQETQQQKEELKKLYQERVRAAQEAERRAEEAARLAANEAVNQLKEMLRESGVPQQSQEAQNTSSTRRSSSGSNMNVVKKQYYASIITTLQPHWKPPEHKIWDPDLFATVVIEVSPSGTITRQFFERKSGDRVFDRFVLKALSDGAPLPPIPAAVGTTSMEIGLRFTVDSIE